MIYKSPKSGNNANIHHLEIDNYIFSDIRSEKLLIDATNR